ncbi:hypothetical protein H4R35_000168 [Dimargaris xerosporica]|nr:hypothetical protein H4R35_000168 [Dimargaris xerosporica]
MALDLWESALASLHQAWAALGQHMREFVAAVDWTQRWLQLLLAAHATLLGLILWSRHQEQRLAVILVVLSGLIVGAERLNLWGSAYWQRFAVANYFDASGHFITMVYSLPLLGLLLLTVVCLVIRTGQLLIIAKRRQLRAAAKKSE